MSFIRSLIAHIFQYKILCLPYIFVFVESLSTVNLQYGYRAVGRLQLNSVSHLVNEAILVHNIS